MWQLLSFEHLKRLRTKFSVLTFGTRNWTVRDIPPSHEAISIMKPAEKTRQVPVTGGWGGGSEAPSKFVRQKSIKLPSNKAKGLSLKICHRACITELDLFKESRPPKGQLRAKTSRRGWQWLPVERECNNFMRSVRPRCPDCIRKRENTGGTDTIFKDWFLFYVFVFFPPFR